MRMENYEGLFPNLFYGSNFWCWFFSPTSSFILKYDKTNILATNQSYASNMDTHIYPLKYPHHPLLKISYNKIHTVILLVTPPFPQQHYPYQKSKRYSTLTDAEPPPKTPSFFNPPSLSCIPLTSGHEPHPRPYSTPLQLTSGALPYHQKIRNPLPNWGLGLSLLSPISLQYFLMSP